MATDSVMGLFATPEQIQQAQYQQVLDRNIRLAQLNPMQRAQAQLGTASYQLGGAIGSALGAEDPQLARATQRRAFIQQVNMADPQSLAQAIRASANDPELSTFLMGKYKELTGIQKDQSVITKNENWQTTQADAEKKRNVVAEVEDKLARGETVDNVTLNKAKLAFGDISRPKTYQQPDGSIVTVAPSVDSSMFPNIGKYMSSSVAGGGGKAGVITTPASEKVAAQAEQAQDDTLANLKNGLTNIDKARGLTKSWTTNPWISATTENLPTDAMALKDTVTALNSQKTIDLISRMKQQSKTGATGFGSVTEKELDLLQSDIVKLNYRSPTFKADLKRVEDKWKEIITKIETEKAQKGSSAAPAQQRTPAANNDDERKIREYIAYNRKRLEAQGITGKEPTYGEAQRALREAGRIK